MSDKCSECGSTHDLSEFTDHDGPGDFMISLDGKSRMPENLDYIIGINPIFCNSCINKAFLSLVDEANHGDFVSYLPSGFASLVEKDAYDGLINTDVHFNSTFFKRIRSN